MIGALACESTSSEEDEMLPGTFIGKVGDSPNSGLYEELEGPANFNYVDSDSTFNIILISNLISDSLTTAINFRLKTLTEPIVGTYTINEIDELNQVTETGFSGYYFSPTVGLSEQYYSESGTLTITSKDEFGRIFGTFDVVIYYKAITDSINYTKSYSSMSGEFIADPEI